LEKIINQKNKLIVIRTQNVAIQNKTRKNQPDFEKTGRKPEKPLGNAIEPHRKATRPCGTIKNRTETEKTAQKCKKPSGNGIRPRCVAFPPRF
jgi:hypothetical protein